MKTITVQIVKVEGKVTPEYSVRVNAKEVTKATLLAIAENYVRVIKEVAELLGGKVEVLK